MGAVMPNIEGDYNVVRYRLPAFRRSIDRLAACRQNLPRLSSFWHTCRMIKKEIRTDFEPLTEYL